MVSSILFWKKLKWFTISSRSRFSKNYQKAWMWTNTVMFVLYTRKQFYVVLQLIVRYFPHFRYYKGTSLPSPCLRGCVQSARLTRRLLCGNEINTDNDEVSIIDYEVERVMNFIMVIRLIIRVIKLIIVMWLIVIVAKSW